MRGAGCTALAATASFSATGSAICHRRRRHCVGGSPCGTPWRDVVRKASFPKPRDVDPGTAVHAWRDPACGSRFSVVSVGLVGNGCGSSASRRSPGRDSDRVGQQFAGRCRWRAHHPDARPGVWRACEIGRNAQYFDQHTGDDGRPYAVPSVGCTSVFIDARILSSAGIGVDCGRAGWSSTGRACPGRWVETSAGWAVDMVGIQSGTSI